MMQHGFTLWVCLKWDLAMPGAIRDVYVLNIYFSLCVLNKFYWSSMCKTKHRVKKIPQSEDMGRRNTREREQNQFLATPRRATILFNKHPNIYSYWSSKQCWEVYGPWVRMLQAVSKVLSVRGLWLFPAFEVAWDLCFSSVLSGDRSLSVSLPHHNWNLRSPPVIPSVEWGVVFNPGTHPRTAEGGRCVSQKSEDRFRVQDTWILTLGTNSDYCNNNTSPSSLLESMWALRFTMKPQRCCPEITGALEEQLVVEGLPAYCLHTHEVWSAAQQNKGMDNLLLLPNPGSSQSCLRNSLLLFPV